MTIPANWRICTFAGVDPLPGFEASAFTMESHVIKGKVIWRQLPVVVFAEHTDSAHAKMVAFLEEQLAKEKAKAENAEAASRRAADRHAAIKAAKAAAA